MGGWLCAALGLSALAGASCQESYRIGERVLVEYDGKRCPGYVIEKRSPTRVRVHFDFEGFPWQDDLSLDRVIRILKAEVPSCPLPSRVRATLGLRPSSSARARTGPYRVGERVRVKWRESVYLATVVEVVGSDRVKVHYHGHEKVWDETISVDRIVVPR